MPVINSTNKGLTSIEREKLAKIDVGIKSNLNVTSAPMATDDTAKGYSVGSTWIYNNITYLCGDATKDNAVWVSTANVYYFNTWAELLAAISVTGTTYVNKYATLANANGAPSGGTTYTSPATLTDYIVDGGGAVYKINTQGANYSVTCQARTITNPIVKSVMVISAAKPIVKGYYIFTVTPTDGLPTGISLNDIAYFNGTSWSLYQLYVKANTVLVATNQTGTTQVTWRKFAGTWMSTADEFIPDGNEYQTSKLWNGKAVYRKCWNGTTPSANATVYTGHTIPTTGTVLLTLGNVVRSDSKTVMIAGGGEIQILAEMSTGKIYIWVVSGSTLYPNKSYIGWCEYTKS